MSKDTDQVQTASKTPPERTGPWRKFWGLVSEPWTAILLIVSIVLFAIGQQKLAPSVTALVQILLAVSSGVLGARVTNLLESASGKNILEARGKVAVRGLKLMLVQTGAFQRRLQKFIENRQHIEQNPEVTVRNYEEAVEFCRRIQEEAASAMETWADVVPTADLSSLIGRITAAEEEHDATKRELVIAQQLLDSNKVDVAHAEQLREVISSLKERFDASQERVAKLNKILHERTAGENSGAAAKESKNYKNALIGLTTAENRIGRSPSSLGLLYEFLTEDQKSVGNDDKK
ncbi:hypothetical protein NB722_000793 [Xanthomonas sacchari]|uniref:hypothetical protein n=1 Tax=Xanthomonas sacchari TaxID=56458 RepID=UPI0022574CF5|nr:hypothetical protein [Xanthomonas sacchari]MCW0386254.1 hypothetical protein [Xanthomonas sacchari]